MSRSASLLGLVLSATTYGHVVYESRLELARILLADRDSDVVAIAAQPFLLEGSTTSAPSACAGSTTRPRRRDCDGG